MVEREPEELARIRRRIDALDRHLVETLDARARLALRAGAVKQACALGIAVPEREDEVIARACEHARAEMPPTVVEDLMRVIVGTCRRLQQRPRVAHLGPAGTFSHVAAHARFGSTAEFVPTPTIDDAIERVATGDVDHAVVPIEGTAVGRVGETEIAVRRRVARVRVTSEFPVTVSYRLIARERDAAITEVRSHPAVLRACASWIEGRLPGVRLVESASTAAAVAEVAASGRRELAALGADLAATLHGLCVIATHAAPATPITRFWIVGPNQVFG